MSKMGTPIKVVKAGDKSISSVKAESVAVAVSGKKVEPEAQLVEAEPGVYDITFTCSCGERTVLRCYSVENSSKSVAVSTPPPPPPPSPAKPAAKPAEAPSASEKED